MASQGPRCAIQPERDVVRVVRECIADTADAGGVDCAGNTHCKRGRTVALNVLAVTGFRK